MTGSSLGPLAQTRPDDAFWCTATVDVANECVAAHHQVGGGGLSSWVSGMGFE